MRSNEVRSPAPFASPLIVSSPGWPWRRSLPWTPEMVSSPVRRRRGRCRRRRSGDRRRRGRGCGRCRRCRRWGRRCSAGAGARCRALPTIVAASALAGTMRPIETAAPTNCIRFKLMRRASPLVTSPYSARFAITGHTALTQSSPSVRTRWYCDGVLEDAPRVRHGVGHVQTASRNRPRPRAGRRFDRPRQALKEGSRHARSRSHRRHARPRSALRPRRRRRDPGARWRRPPLRRRRQRQPLRRVR